MKQSTKNQIKGSGRQLKGSIKETVGRATGSRGMQARGKVEKVAGKVQKKAGNAMNDLEEDFAATHPSGIFAKAESVAHIGQWAPFEIAQQDGIALTFVELMHRLVQHGPKLVPLRFRCGLAV